MHVFGCLLVQSAALTSLATCVSKCLAVCAPWFRHHMAFALHCMKYFDKDVRLASVDFMKTLVAAVVTHSPEDDEVRGTVTAYVEYVLQLVAVERSKEVVNDVFTAMMAWVRASPCPGWGCTMVGPHTRGSVDRRRLCSLQPLSRVTKRCLSAL
jgi:hypothetical protein